MLTTVIASRGGHSAETVERNLRRSLSPTKGVPVEGTESKSAQYVASSQDSQQDAEVPVAQTHRHCEGADVLTSTEAISHDRETASVHSRTKGPSQ